METHVTDIARIIQLAVAPVFLLTAIGTILSALNNRLGRIVGCLTNTRRFGYSWNSSTMYDRMAALPSIRNADSEDVSTPLSAKSAE